MAFSVLRIGATGRIALRRAQVINPRMCVCIHVCAAYACDGVPVLGLVLVFSDSNKYESTEFRQVSLTSLHLLDLLDLISLTCTFPTPPSSQLQFPLPPRLYLLSPAHFLHPPYPMRPYVTLLPLPQRAGHLEGEGCVAGLPCPRPVHLPRPLLHSWRQRFRTGRRKKEEAAWLLDACLPSRSEYRGGISHQHCTDQSSRWCPVSV